MSGIKVLGKESEKARPCFNLQHMKNWGPRAICFGSDYCDARHSWIIERYDPSPLEIIINARTALIGITECLCVSVEVS